VTREGAQERGAGRGAARSERAASGANGNDLRSPAEKQCLPARQAHHSQQRAADR
jgi:hypothetical protein